MPIRAGAEEQQEALSGHAGTIRVLREERDRAIAERDEARGETRRLVDLLLQDDAGWGIVSRVRTKLREHPENFLATPGTGRRPR